MFTTFLLLTCAAALGQAGADRGDWQLAPLLSPGLEFVYRGSCLEESLIPNVQYQRNYRLESNLLVLDGSAKDWQVAVLTTMTLRDPRQGSAEQRDGPTSLRLTQIRVDPQGRVRTMQKKPIDLGQSGPPLAECGCFVPAPLVPVNRHAGWDVADEGKPGQHWQVVGVERIGVLACVKVTCVQQSDDWDHARADHAAWRRRDTLWIWPQFNVAQKVERIIEERAAARTEPTHRTTIRYELDSHMKYLSKFFEDRKHDVVKACQFQDDAQVLMRDPQLYRGQIEALLQRVSYQVDHVEKTPYRLVMVHVKQALQNAKKGEAPVPHVAEEPMTPSIQALEIGQQAPDFTVSSLTSSTATRLRSHRGTPVLVAFYNPSTSLGREVLRHLKSLSEKHHGKLVILAMAATQDDELVRKQHQEMKLSFPILDGNAMRLTFGATQTPRFVLLDGDGVVRLAQTGWGTPTPIEIDMALDSCLKK